MNIAETARLIAILKMAWPSHPLDTEQGAAVYHRALSDIPFDLAERAVDEYIRTGKFFPAPSELRELALRAGLDLPAAEIAWTEAQRIISEWKRDDGPPQWSSKVLEDAVNAIGWWNIQHCDASDLGTMRAQFRDTYNALLKATAAGDAQAALESAGDRREMLGFLRRPRVESAPVEAHRPMALSPSPPRAPDGYDTMGKDAPATRWAAERFAERSPTRALPLPAGDPAAMLRRITSAPEWSETPADLRQQQLQRFLTRHPECADLPELAGITPDAPAKPALEHLTVDLAGVGWGALRLPAANGAANER